MRLFISALPSLRNAGTSGLFTLATALYYGAFLGASSALVADLVPDRLRGIAYGIFNAALGVAALPASLIAGLLWDWYGPAAPFLFGAALAVTATIGLLIIPLKRDLAPPT